MKKILSLTLSVALLLGATISTGDADYSIKRFPGQREYTKKYRSIDFNDVRGTWLQEAAYTVGALGMAKGTGGGNFMPGATLTTEQALIFLTRLMGWEGQAQRMGLDIVENRDTGGRYSHENYHITAVGTIALLESKEILTEEDIQNIAPLTAAEQGRIASEVARELDRYRDYGLAQRQLDNIAAGITEVREREVRWGRPASREVVAYILGKMVSETDGITGDQQQAINTFQDRGYINGNYVPYIEEVVQKGLMIGTTGNRFNPKARLTRGEMAQILYNAHEDQMLKRGYLIEHGKIIDIRTESGTDGSERVTRRIIKVQTEENEIIEFYSQASLNGNMSYQKGTITYVNNRLADQQALRVGQAVRYYIKPSGEVVFAKQLLREPESFSGKVLGLYENMILIEGTGGNLHRYRLAREVDFKVNGRWNELDNLVPGMRGSFHILNGNIVGIDVTVQEGGIGGGGNISVGDYFHTGTVVSTRTNSRSLTIARDRLGENLETYNLDAYPNLPVYKDGKRIDFTSIRPGDFLRVYFSDLDNSIEKIELRSFNTRNIEAIYKGSILNYNRNRNQIRLGNGSRLDGASNWEKESDDKTLQISDNADLYVTDRNGTTDILISRDAFEDYGNYKQQQAEYIEHALKEGKNLYLYTERRNGREEITRIVLREVGEYKFSGLVENRSSGVISIPSNQNIYYNNSTIVVSGGRLVSPASLSRGDSITVYTHDGRNTAAIVIVEGEDISNYPYTAYSTRLSGVNITRQTVEVSGTGSQKIQGTSLTPFPLETLNLPTDAQIQVIKPSQEPETISVERFFNRYYADFEHKNAKLVTDSNQNILKLQVYDSEMVRPRLDDIRVARVNSKNLASGTVELGQVRTWTNQSWSTGVESIDLDFSRAIIISDGRLVGLDRIRDGSSVYVLGDVNTGHVLIVR